MKIFNFEHQFVKYGEFHANKINQAIHLVFVPTILWTAQVWLTASPIYYNWSYGKVLPINAAFIGTAIYSGYYITLHKVIGTLYAPILFSMLYGANVFAKLDPSQLGSLSPMVAATGIHITSWIFQILGHQVFEGRAPAFTKDPLQAIVLAPFFVFCELLFALGFYSKTAVRLEKMINEKVQLWKKGKKSQ